MTPGIQIAKRAKINFQIHEYEHDPNSDSYGLEAAEKMGVEPTRVFKTLVVDCGSKKLAVAVLPVNAQLSLKTVAKALGEKKVVMADKQLVEKTTGYVLGGVSPLGQKKRLATLIDDSANSFTRIYVSAGKRGLEIELSPQDLKELTGAKLASIIA